MVNCALGSRSDEFALDPCACCAASSSEAWAIWRDGSFPRAADGRLEMIRDSMLKMCLYRVYRLKETEWKAECKAQIRNAVNADSPSFSPSPDNVHGAVKRDTSETNNRAATCVTRPGTGDNEVCAHGLWSGTKSDGKSGTTATYYGCGTQAVAARQAS